MTPPQLQQGLPPGTPEGFAWFASWIGEQFGKIEGKLDSLSKEFVTRREIERLQSDIDSAHRKVRELEQGPVDDLEDRVRTIELEGAGDKARFTMGEKTLGVVFVVIQLGVTVWLALR